MLVKNQQHIRQIIHFLMHLITKFEMQLFCNNITQNVNVLRGAYPTWIKDSVTSKRDLEFSCDFDH